jgi:ribosomal protein S18 acetylase RimI-like enzyme
MDVIRTKDRDLLREVFRRDPIASMYMAGDLDEPVFSQCEWFAATQSGRALAVLLIFHGLSVPSVLATGDVECVRRILAHVNADLPAKFYTKLDAEQRAVFRDYFEFEGAEPLTVMFLEQFRAEFPRAGVGIRLLQPADAVEEIRGLYRDYPGNFFEPAHMAHNVYCGAWEGGALAAIAGTHAFAPPERVAVLGNVVTSARKRGRGLCRQTCSFLVEELLRRGCESIGLHVGEDNEPAIRCYRSIGFARHSSLMQALAGRRRGDHVNSGTPKNR